MGPLNPGCNCCECVKFFDLFDRADSTDVGANWTEVAGDWTIASNKLQTTTANALIVNTVDLPEEHHVFAVFSLTTTGDIARFVLDYIDTDNYRCFEFEKNAGTTFTRRLIRRVAGAETTIRTDTVAATDPLTVSLCSETESLTQAASTSGIGLIDPKLGGKRIGFATKTLTGTFSIQNMSAWKAAAVADLHSDGLHGVTSCGPCGSPCAGCQERAGPKQLKVVIAGMGDAGCVGGNCDNYDGTYYLDLAQDDDNDATNCSAFAEFSTANLCCSWRFNLTLADNQCDSGILKTAPFVRVVIQDDGKVSGFIGETGCSGTNLIGSFWKDATVVTRNCSGLVDLSLPFVSNILSCSIPFFADKFWNCTGAAGTFKVSTV